ncbi:MAG: hypothetical protein IJI49_01455 [Bacilli bacterium]|nr:hypothetical protein [Bacilli bacterium]
MNYTLPYYGKKGTIAKIDENKRFYLVSRYGTNKKEKYILEVPKTSLNKELLMQNYYNDLNEYLIISKDKYNEYYKSKDKKIKGLNIIKLTGILMLGSSVPLLKTYNTLGYIGIALDVLSMPVIITAIKLSIDDKKLETKNKFINKYEELNHKLKIYNESKEINLEKTKYSKVVKDEKTPKRDLKKILERKKEYHN